MNGEYDYAIVGAGLAAASAVEGIREVDPNGSILMLGSEGRLPYNRPPLSKSLWSGKKKLEDIFVHDQGYYADNGVDMFLDTTATAIDPSARHITDSHAGIYTYRKLLIATGGTPRKLDIDGGDLDGVFYYRNLRDYEQVRARADQAESALVIGGGYIGTEMAAALTMAGLQVTIVFPEDYLCRRLFSPGLAGAIAQDYQQRGIRIVTGDVPESLGLDHDRFVMKTRGGHEVRGDVVIAGIGISPNVQLAEGAGLTVDNGIVVNEYLQTSDADTYAASDVARFPYRALGGPRRIEHWDHAVNSGKQAGRNLAGAGEPYDYMPYFFSDLFDFGYEAVGDVDSSLEMFEDWQEEHRKGVVYYLRDSRVVGAMMCDVWDKVPQARELIQRGETVTPESLRGSIS